MTTKESLAAWKSFLETTPPNVPHKITNLFDNFHPQSGGNPVSVPLPEIELFCQTDGGLRLFTSDREYAFPTGGSIVSYKCRKCGQGTKMFALMINQEDPNKPNDGEVMKLGEFPPFGAPISIRIEKLLGKTDLELYRKGMRSEAQGLGIGAATYFRRIVDNQWKQLVAEIREAAAKLGYTDLSVFDRAMNETLFSRAVDMLRDATTAKGLFCCLRLHAFRSEPWLLGEARTVKRWWANENVLLVQGETVGVAHLPGVGTTYHVDGRMGVRLTLAQLRRRRIDAILQPGDILRDVLH